MGPKEKAFYQKRAKAWGWRKEDWQTVIMEDVDANFFDIIQDKPNGIEEVEADINFNEEDFEEE